MPRIILTVTNDLSYDQRMQRICTALAGGGFELTLVGRLRKNSRPLPDFPFRTERIPVRNEKGKLFYAEYNYRLYQYLLKAPADILCAIDLDTIVPAAAVARRRKLKAVYDAHELFTEVPEVVGRLLIKKIWAEVARRTIPKMDLCYTVGPMLAEWFSDKYKKPFEVIRNVPVLREDDVLPAEQKPAPFILYQGALNEGRGLEVLIDAMPELPVSLVVAGEGDLSESLRARAAASEAKDRIKFLGFVPPQELKKLTREAWLGYNLLEARGLSYYYSLSNKFFDYMHAGVPNLSPPFPEYERITEKHAVALLLPLDRAKIVETILRLVNVPKDYEALRQQCLLARHLYHWEQEKEKLLNLYHAL